MGNVSLLQRRLAGADDDRRGKQHQALEYIWSAAYVDGLVARNRDNNLSMSDGFEERIYVIQDANWNVTAIVDTGGAVLERYIYDPYGKPTYLTPTWGSRSNGGNYEFANLLEGGPTDLGSRTVNFRNREYNYELMRWMQPDDAYRDGGNLYEFVRSNPVNGLDPMGLVTMVTSGSSGPVGGGGGGTPQRENGKYTTQVVPGRGSSGGVMTGAPGREIPTDPGNGRPLTPIYPNPPLTGVWIGGCGLHGQICIGTNKPGGASCYSFGAKTRFHVLRPWEKGVIYPDEQSPVSCQTRMCAVDLSPKQIQKLTKLFEEMEGDRMWYSVFSYNCNNWVKDMCGLVQDLIRRGLV